MIAAMTAEIATEGLFRPWAVAAALALLATNGAFTAAEIALLASRRSRVEQAAEVGDKRARAVLVALRRLPVTFSGTQLGVTMSSLGLGAVAEPAVAALLARWLAPIGLPDAVVPVVAVSLALTVVAFLHLVVGDMAPKNLALAHPERVAFRLARPFGWFVAVFRPLIAALNVTSRGVLRLVRVEPVDEHKLVHTPQELALVLAESREHGAISAHEASVMSGVLRLETIDAQAAMTPRTDLVAIADNADNTELLELAAATGHTRFPVFHGEIDNVVGIVHVKDALVLADDARDAIVGDLMRPITAVPETRDLEGLLRDMRSAGHHAVLVVDEHGATAGLVTLEDVVEELVGEIDDEFDATQHPRRGSSRQWQVPGTLRCDELERLTGLVLPLGESSTVSGWMVEHLGRLLEVGDEVSTGDGWTLTVRALEGRRAGLVDVRAPTRGRQ